MLSTPNCDGALFIENIVVFWLKFEFVVKSTCRLCKSDLRNLHNKAVVDVKS